MKQRIATELAEYKLLLRSVPALALVLYVISVVLMNFLANKEINTGIDWLALDCGLTVSWLSFLCMDMITKRFGARASIKLSIIAIGMNLFVCMMLYLISIIPGNWGEYYTYGEPMINDALNDTIGGTWYILFGSMVAMFTASVVNALMNEGIGRLLKKDSFRSFAIRSYISTFFAQFLDNFIFSVIVSRTFFGWTWMQCLACSMAGCLAEVLCEIIFSPLGYKGCKRWEKENVGHSYISKYRQDI